MNDFKVGQLIVYVNGPRYEIGKIKKLCDHGAFVNYHAGSTAAMTPYDLMHPIMNDYNITETTLGADKDEV